MTYDKAVTTAGETAVGDERHILAKSEAHDGARRSEHFAHAGPTFRSFEANDNDIALVDLLGENRLHREIFRIEDARVAGEDFTFLTGNFCDRPTLGEVAVKHAQVAVFFERIIQRTNDLLAFGIRLGEFLKVLAHGATGHGHAITVQQPGIEQHLHQWHGAADADEIGHDIFAGRFEVCEYRHALADPLEVIERDVDTRRMRHCRQVQRRVGRATQCDQHGDGIFEGFPGENVAWLDAEIDEVHHCRARIERVAHFIVGHGRLRRAVGQRKAECFNRAGHRVGGVHATAGTRTGNRAGFDRFQLGIGILAIGMFAHRFENRNDIEILFLPFQRRATRQNRAAVNKH